MTSERESKFSESMGRAVARGICYGLLTLCMSVLLASLLINSAYNWLDVGLDDSDRDGWNRSGMTVRTDYLTGRQYLSTAYGLTPRLDAAGVQIIIKEPKP